jgi:trehalose 6-phosphate synthase
MRRTIYLVVALVFVLGIITWLTATLVEKTIRDWFESDVKLRAELAVNGARSSLFSNWNSDQVPGLQSVLEEIAHDERIMGVAACGQDLTLLSRTKDFPAELSCSELGSQILPASGAVASSGTSWNSVRSLPGGKAHVSAIPLFYQDRPFGFVTLVHDLSYIERREARTRQFLLFAFGFLAVAASGVTMIAARLAWHGWTTDFRTFLRGGKRPEFQPLMHDVRQLVDRLVSERETDGGGTWTPHRLRYTLNRHLQGEKVVVVANREPYIHERNETGDGIRILNPASGLVTALEPVRQRIATAAFVFRRVKNLMCSADFGCRLKRNMATTTDCQTKVSGHCATLRMRAQSFGAKTGNITNV